MAETMWQAALMKVWKKALILPSNVCIQKKKIVAAVWPSSHNESYNQSINLWRRNLEQIQTAGVGLTSERDSLEALTENLKEEKKKPRLNNLHGVFQVNP